MIVQSAKAQDPHFSQYFSSPLTFNPAFTGYFDGAQRLSVNFRNQWSGSDAFTTGTVAFDTKIMSTKIAAGDRWGVGVHALYDQAAGGVFKNTYLSFSTAFNKALDENGDQSIGIGVQATFARNAVDFNNISFSSQFSGTGFDLSVPSGETINNRSVSYVDLNAGVLYNYKDENGNQFSFGGAMFHVLQPKVSFFSGVTNVVQRRFAVHGSGFFTTGEYDNFFVSAHMMKQNTATEYVIGGAYGLGMGAADRNIYLGAWMRVNDAVYPYIGLRMPAYQIGFSYDITNTDLRKTKNYSNSTELSFIYLFNSSGEKRKGIPCFF